jgi:hypothetical protein
MATGWTNEGSGFESRWGQECSLLHVVETCSGIHPTSYPMGTVALSQGVKLSTPPGSAEVRKMWIYYMCASTYSPIRFHGVVLN